ncbi:PaaI family thioesterase [Rhodobacter capsulatus]|uniref:PaaI family thioesterase n=1 Tax=Rhodobacter capsulatus TaxID=1061 RepID=A0A4U1JSL9_RHOCA|nr:PaaI family thioesterase [Rhodobacter capsulatus]TKD18236.1 PaaI family thioesterase [Rhodobacter capsulatus]
MQLKMDVTALNAFLRRDFAQVADMFEVIAAGEETLIRLRIDDSHLRPGGTVSGPSMFALADVGIYLAILSRIGPVALSVTTSATIDFLRKPLAGVDLLARVRVLKLGRNLAVGDCLIFSEGEAEPVARASMTYAIPPAR